MDPFPHLKFEKKISGNPRFYGGGKPNPHTLNNRKNRKKHSDSLFSKTNSIKSDWEKTLKDRKEKDLAIIDESTSPVFLQVNPEIITAQFDLESYGIEIISEEENGYIIGASLDNLRTLEAKIEGFIKSERGTASIADLWQIIDGNREEWKPRHILSEQLFSQWDKIKDDDCFQIEVSVAFAKPLYKEPNPEVRGYEKKKRKHDNQMIARDVSLMERQDHFAKFISHYGKILSSLVELDDSFACEVEISGKGLKDLVVNYQYVFEVSEIDEVAGIEGNESNFEELEIEIIPPDDDAVEVGVIDSGIMENHKYIEPAIKNKKSKSYTKDASTADYVKGGGHGTKVAGAILFPKGITEIESPYKLPCFIRNLRILNEHNKLQDNYPASLIQQIINGNDDCKVFNLSVSSNSPCRTKHMSTWASVIDKMSFENDILFITCSGNISFPIIRHYISNNARYPDYLEENACRIANPSQSIFSLTVGSLNPSHYEDEYWKSLGNDNDISAFSRTGLGIWDSIKPDIVEYGGGVIVSKNGAYQIREHESISPELIRSTLHGGSAIGRDSVGTSFSTPKVTNIAAILMQMYPNENTNLIKALIAQGARLPGDFFLCPTKRSITYFGYGVPSIERVIKNTEQRITFYNSGQIQAEEGHIYSLKIPEELRNPGDDYNFLIEVTLAYSAQVRRTRQKTKSYLSTWLDWRSSKIGETIEKFKDFVLKEPDEEEPAYDSEYRKDLDTIQWKIRNRNDHGDVKEVSRSNSSLQKDWAIIKSYDLPDEICFVVRGHKGWDKNKMAVPYALAVSIEILEADIPIYELIKIENEIEIET